VRSRISSSNSPNAARSVCSSVPDQSVSQVRALARSERWPGQSVGLIRNFSPVARLL
jgi:hypothetical protein